MFSRLFDSFSCEVFEQIFFGRLFSLIKDLKLFRTLVILWGILATFGDILRFKKSVSCKFDWSLIVKETLILAIYSSLVFCYYIILGGHILNISKTIFPKLIFHLPLSYQISDVLLQEFHINFTYVIYHCI